MSWSLCPSIAKPAHTTMHNNTKQLDQYHQQTSKHAARLGLHKWSTSEAHEASDAAIFRSPSLATCPWVSAGVTDEPGQSHT